MLSNKEFGCFWIIWCIIAALSVGMLGLIVWVIVKFMQYFGVI